MRHVWERRLLATCVILLAFGEKASSDAYVQPFEAAAAAQERVNAKSEQSDENNAPKKEPTAEEKMQARFPQPVLAGHLIGLPVLDGNDSTIGYVQQAVRTPEGKIKLIVPYGKRFGWSRNGSLVDWGRRPVAVPIEVVAILGLQIAALDLERDAFEKAATWTSKDGSRPIPSDEIIKIAIQRR